MALLGRDRLLEALQSFHPPPIPIPQSCSPSSEYGRAITPPIHQARAATPEERSASFTCGVLPDSSSADNRPTLLAGSITKSNVTNNHRTGSAPARIDFCVASCSDPAIDQYLQMVAHSGRTMFEWRVFRTAFLWKLEAVLRQMLNLFPFPDPRTKTKTETVSVIQPVAATDPSSNLDTRSGTEMIDEIMKTARSLDGIPFSIQRLCELLTSPRRHYKRADKFMRAVEKTLKVVTKVTPDGTRLTKADSPAAKRPSITDDESQHSEVSSSNSALLGDDMAMDNSFVAPHSVNHIVNNEHEEHDIAAVKVEPANEGQVIAAVKVEPANELINQNEIQEKYVIKNEGFELPPDQVRPDEPSPLSTAQSLIHEPSEHGVPEEPVHSAHSNQVHKETDKDAQDELDELRLDEADPNEDMIEDVSMQDEDNFQPDNDREAEAAEPSVIEPGPSENMEHDEGPSTSTAQGCEALPAEEGTMTNLTTLQLPPHTPCDNDNSSRMEADSTEPVPKKSRWDVPPEPPGTSETPPPGPPANSETPPEEPLHNSGAQ